MKREQEFLTQVTIGLGIAAEGVSPPLRAEECHLLETSGYALYEQGDYTSTAQIFTQLVLYDPFCERYWRGLAASRQMRQEYQASLHAWALVALLQEKDPLPHVHAAECYLSLHHKEEAGKALQVAQELLGSAAEDQQLHEKITLLKRTAYAPATR